MKKLFVLAGLLLALTAAPAVATPPPHPLPWKGGVALPARPAAGPIDELTQEARAAYYYLVGIVGIEPCDALKVVLGSETSNNAQRYAHARLRELGYDFPTPDPTTAFDCPL